MTISTNPNQTSGRLNSQQSSLTFPLNEQPIVGTRLRFVKYKRFTPGEDSSEETTSVINLPIPLSIPDVSSIQTTGNIDMGVFGNINEKTVGRVLGIEKSIEDLGFSETLKLGSSAIGESLKRNIADLKNQTLKGLALTPIISENKRNIAQVFAGIVANPHTTILFQGVNLKAFNLEWRLSPRTKQESDALDKIIKTIKLRIHPEEVGGGFALDYPDLVYVEWFGPSGKYLPKFQRAFVNSFVAQPDSGGGISLYNSGAPTSYSIQLALSEINIRTRNSLQEEQEQSNE